MKPIHEILEKTQANFDRSVFEHFMRWCAMNSNNDNDHQCLLANAAIFNWWQCEYQSRFSDFREEIGPYLKTADKSEKALLFLQTVVLPTNDKYPRALMQTARKINIVCQMN